MKKILAIGNSFSQDATRYLYDIAKAGGIEIKVVNLCIGGCSLETHWNNIMGNSALYGYELNGKSAGYRVSIKMALMEEDWDYVTLQQVSGDSGIPDTFYPYLRNISEYITRYAPSAKQLLHQTWAYEWDSDHPDFIKYNNNQEKMYEEIINTYKSLGEEFSFRVIPSGRVIQELRYYPEFDYAHGGMSLCRDGFHMSLDYGRYAVAATWFEHILKGDITENGFTPNDINMKEKTDISKIKLIKKVVHRLEKLTEAGWPSLLRTDV